MRISNLVKGAGLALGVAALLAGPAGATAPSPVGAAAAAGAEAGVYCGNPDANALLGAAARGMGRGQRDTPEVTPSQALHINRLLAGAAARLALGRKLGLKPGETSDRTTSGSTSTSSGSTSTTSASAVALPDIVYINVYVHNIYGTKAGEADIGSGVVKKLIDNLNSDYAHGEKSWAPHSRYRFRLMSNTVFRNEKFYHAQMNGSTDLYWRRQLHRGDRNDLNIYLRDLHDNPNTPGLLGYSTFPWNYANNPRLDSVNIDSESLPGRQLTHYNQGDTGTHEVGHWLGLLHPFEGGCQDDDGVSDTPAQQQLNACPPRAYTCSTLLSKGGLSQPGNFMQYTYDECMVAFTSGQIRRMDSAWVQFRM